MRPRRRYIAFEISGTKMGKNDVIEVLKYSFRLLLNSELNRRLFKLVFYEASSQRGLLRCGHKQVDEVKTALTGKEKIGNKRVSFRILGVSGTIKAAKRKFLAPPQAKG
jgi:RNase P/RNase MRP subunit POP5